MAKIIVCFSGGKDSQACLIQACKEFGPDKVEALFCDTGWEHQLTYDHVINVTNSLGVKLVTLKSRYGSFQDLCKQMKWFPDSQKRMCTVRLKIYPMIDYILSHQEDLIIIQGIRAAESAARSKLPCSADYFKDYFDKDRKTKKLYRVTDVRLWCQRYRAIVERPMLGMSAQNVIDYILENGQEPNPLYKKGKSRVGCYPCIYARMQDISTMRHEKKYVDRVIDLEREVNEIRKENFIDPVPASFFPKGKIPERFCKTFGHSIPAFQDVIDYVSRDDAQLDMFDSGEGGSCMSIYHGLCE